MVSTPSAKRFSASGENTAATSRSPLGRSDSAQSSLSAAAAATISSHIRLARGFEEGARRLDRPVDLAVTVGEGDEESLELRRREVHVLVEQVAEEGAVAVEVAGGRVVEAPDRTFTHEEREQRADAVHARGGVACLRQAPLEPLGAPLELVVHGLVA